MLAIVVLAGAIWFGFSILRLTGARLSPEERLVAGTVFGLAAGFWLIYLMASSVGGLSGGVLVGSLIAFAFTGLAATRRPRVTSVPPARWFVALLLIVGLGLLTLNLFGVMSPDGQGNVRAAEHIWADTPFHASQATAFAYRDNFPPTFTIALGQPLTYPFLVNFVTGTLMHAGWELRTAYIFVNVLIQLLFFGGLALITLRLTGSRRAAVMAVGLFFVLGNLGFFAVPKDITKANGFANWIGNLPWSYTGDALGGPGRDRLGTGLYLGNPVYIYLLPERSSAFGLAAAMVLLLLFDRLIETDHRAAGTKHSGTAVAAGLLFGLLPRIQAHAVFIVLAAVVVWFILKPARDGAKGRSEWTRTWLGAVPSFALAGGIALALALPQVLAEAKHSSGFFSIWLGWAGEPHEAWDKVLHGPDAKAAALGTAVTTTIRFWILNAGLLLFLAFPAFRRASRRLRIWYAPFVVLWLFANVIKTQPWEWDNNNFFIYWQLATVVLVAPYLVSFFERKDVALRATGAALVAVLSVGGLLSYVYWGEHRYALWRVEEVRLAEWVRDNTPKDAVVLTSNGHTHPLLALSGRQGYMGFAGWVSVHNLDWATYERRLKEMYAGDVELMRDLGIDYVVIGPWEHGLERDWKFSISPVFDDPGVFGVVRDEVINGQQWKILKLRTKVSA